MITIYRTIDDTYLTEIEVNDVRICLGYFKTKRQAKRVSRRVVRKMNNMIGYLEKYNPENYNFTDRFR